MIYQGVSRNVESPIAGWLISWKERYFTFDWVIYLPFTSINAIYFKPPKALSKAPQGSRVTHRPLASRWSSFPARPCPPWVYLMGISMAISGS